MSITRWERSSSSLPVGSCCSAAATVVTFFLASLIFWLSLGRGFGCKVRFIIFQIDIAFRLFMDNSEVLNFTLKGFKLSRLAKRKGGALQNDGVPYYIYFGSTTISPSTNSKRKWNGNNRIQNKVCGLVSFIIRVYISISGRPACGVRLS